MSESPGKMWPGIRDGPGCPVAAKQQGDSWAVVGEPGPGAGSGARRSPLGGHGAGARGRAPRALCSPADFRTRPT